MLRLCNSIDSACGENAVGTNRLSQIFDALWPKLETQLAAVTERFAKTSMSAAPRDPEELLLELLDLVRGQSRVIASLDRTALPHEASRGRLVRVPGPQDQRLAARSLEAHLHAAGITEARVGPSGPGNPALRVRVPDELPEQVLLELEMMANELGFDILLELRPVPPRHPPGRPEAVPAPADDK
jgi:hypothetical protein